MVCIVLLCMVVLIVGIALVVDAHLCVSMFIVGVSMIYGWVCGVVAWEVQMVRGVCE